MSHAGGGINVHAPIEFLESFGVSTKILLVVFGFGMAYFTYTFLDLRFNNIVKYGIGTAPLWAPFIMFHLFFEHWMYYVRKEFSLLLGRTTLEIGLPQEIFKSPAAMELVLNALHQTSAPDNLKETYIDGKHPPKFSLEIVSRGGEVKFYINVPKKKYKDLIEAHLYAQYPGIEIRELEVDYTAEVVYDPKKYAMMSFHMGLKKADALPIKTYIEFGLDQMPKEEEKVDPIASVLETFGSIAPGEFYWVQFIIDANKEVGFKEGSLHTKADWKGAAAKHIEKMIEAAVKRAGAEEAKGNVMMLLTETERETVKAIERSIGKNAFNTAIRAMYICPADKVRIGDMVPRLLTSFRVYDDLNRNALGVKWRTDFDYNWWQDPKGKRRNHLKKAELDHYKRRYYQEYNHKAAPKIMTTEELATVWHFPGKVAATPSLARLPSKRSEAPANLPVG